MPKYYVTYGFISHKGGCYSVIEAETRIKAWWKANELTNWGIAHVYETKEEAMIRPSQEEIPLEKMSQPWRKPKKDYSKGYKGKKKKTKAKKENYFAPIAGYTTLKQLKKKKLW